ncbi:hypothetical protein N7495_005421 [Penicillium taxi]|uniref:uncharacterized protein n=1 Tax=Penicillium taxi TaxID=168475 RepID=UPI0025450B4C|nr:uncharacterized protein N7495_005421 [Penicillium taxi]KAJ5893730.1 hypothetical protein N7495_005421 [Penicillium taxi]
MEVEKGPKGYRAKPWSRVRHQGKDLPGLLPPHIKLYFESVNALLAYYITFEYSSTPNYAGSVIANFFQHGTRRN